MTQIERKPLLKPGPSGKFKMADFQQEDIASLLERGNSAQWSEMGTFKTTTTEWLVEAKLRHIPNPRVLVITTKTGKGAYLESMPEVLSEWEVFVASTVGFHYVINGKPIRRRNVELPNPLFMRPVMVLAHYNCFTNRACIPKVVERVIEVAGRKVKQQVMNEDGTFQMTKPKCAELMTKHWDAIIVDEAHRMKNPDTQWTRNIKKIKAGFKHVMTGTGFVNNPAEIWSLLNFLYGRNIPDAPNGYWDFRQYFCEEDNWSGYRKIVGIRHGMEDEFRQLVRKVGVRRTMLECFPDIEEPIETVVPVTLSARQQRMYEQIRDELSTLDAQGVPLHSPTVLSALNRLRQICVATPEVTDDYYDWDEERRIIKVRLTEPSSKLDAAMDIIDGLEWDSERKDQTVVFSNFKDPLELLKNRLANRNVPYLHLQASHSEQQRYELWRELWPKKEHQVFLCTLGVGSESINLACANRAIFLDQSWSPAQNKQAIGRIYRPGQTGVAQLIYIRAEGTVDYKVLESNQEKAGWFQAIFGTPADDTDEEAA